MKQIKKYIQLKDIAYFLIIIALIIIIILSKKDFKINLLDKDNWIDIIIGSITLLSSSILSLLIIKQGYKLNEKSEKIEIETFNKQIDLDLRERRLNIYGTFMGIGNIVGNRESLITNFIGGNHIKNEELFNRIISKENDITVALFEAELLLKDSEELLEYIRNISLTFVSYRQELQKYFEKQYIANDEVISMLKKDDIIVDNTNTIPLNIIINNHDEYEKCKKIFYQYYKPVIEKEKRLLQLISDVKIRNLFDKAINISKIGSDVV